MKLVIGRVKATFNFTFELITWTLYASDKFETTFKPLKIYITANLINFVRRQFRLPSQKRQFWKSKLPMMCQRNDGEKLFETFINENYHIQLLPAAIFLSANKEKGFALPVGTENLSWSSACSFAKMISSPKSVSEWTFYVNLSLHGYSKVIRVPFPLSYHLDCVMPYKINLYFVKLLKGTCRRRKKSQFFKSSLCS